MVRPRGKDCAGRKIIVSSGTPAGDRHVASAAAVVAAAAALPPGALRTGSPRSSGGRPAQRCQHPSLGTRTGGRRCSSSSLLLHTGGGQLGEKVSSPVTPRLCCSYAHLALPRNNLEGGRECSHVPGTLMMPSRSLHGALLLG